MEGGGAGVEGVKETAWSARGWEVDGGRIHDHRGRTHPNLLSGSSIVMTTTARSACGVPRLITMVVVGKGEATLIEGKGGVVAPSPPVDTDGMRRARTAVVVMGGSDYGNCWVCPWWWLLPSTCQRALIEGKGGVVAPSPPVDTDGMRRARTAVVVMGGSDYGNCWVCPWWWLLPSTRQRDDGDIAGCCADERKRRMATLLATVRMGGNNFDNDRGSAEAALLHSNLLLVFVEHWWGGGEMVVC
ncbi:hypothetical protein [Oryza sativa Japonica Group]|uniref:Uncharacterized protein n=1 Tax=Oryza sativa subsp. japonica TaxID=39947 RepID=Q5JL25_ORYSJ|nr:hypothetical protein [Oryza sativa Japonica Group]